MLIRKYIVLLALAVAAMAMPAVSASYAAETVEEREEAMLQRIRCKLQDVPWVLVCRQRSSFTRVNEVRKSGDAYMCRMQHTFRGTIEEVLKGELPAPVPLPYECELRYIDGYASIPKEGERIKEFLHYILVYDLEFRDGVVYLTDYDPHVSSSGREKIRRVLCAPTSQEQEGASQERK